MCNNPQTNDPNGILVGDCGRLEGGSKKPSVGDYVLVVSNPGDSIWRDETYIPVQEENDEVILVDNV